jgi:hypothetical protein
MQFWQLYRVVRYTGTVVSEEGAGIPKTFLPDYTEPVAKHRNVVTDMSGMHCLQLSPKNSNFLWDVALCRLVAYQTTLRHLSQTFIIIVMRILNPTFKFYDLNKLGTRYMAKSFRRVLFVTPVS